MGRTRSEISDLDPAVFENDFEKEINQEEKATLAYFDLSENSEEEKDND